MRSSPAAGHPGILADLGRSPGLPGVFLSSRGLMDELTVGLIGMGTVGRGVGRRLAEHRERLERRAGRPIRWKWAAVRDPLKPRGVRLDGVRVTTQADAIIDDPEVDVIVETMGGTDPALGHTLSALRAGKD